MEVLVQERLLQDTVVALSDRFLQLHCSRGHRRPVDLPSVKQLQYQ